MKKVTALLSLVFLLTACSVGTLEARSFGDASKVKVDGCQYIIYVHRKGTLPTGSGITHAGDCTNPIHKEALEIEKQKLEELKQIKNLLKQNQDELYKK